MRVYTCVYVKMTKDDELQIALSALQSLFLITVMALRGQGLSIFVWIKVHFADMALFSIIFSFIVSFFVYFRSFIGNKLLALGGNTGNPIYDVSDICFIYISCQFISCVYSL